MVGECGDGWVKNIVGFSVHIFMHSHFTTQGCPGESSSSSLMHDS
jgi:hypothetical protein